MDQTYNELARPRLSAKATDALFVCLELAYGSRWGYSLGAQPLDAVMDHWAVKLAGFAGDLNSIRDALEHLPEDNPPTADQFRKLAQGFMKANDAEKVTYNPTVNAAALKAAHDFVTAQKVIKPVSKSAESFGNESLESKLRLSIRKLTEPSGLSPIVIEMQTERFVNLNAIDLLPEPYKSKVLTAQSQG